MKPNKICKNESGLEEENFDLIGMIIKGLDGFNSLNKSIVTQAQTSQQLFDVVMTVLRELYKKAVVLVGKSVMVKMSTKFLPEKNKPSPCT